MSRRDTICVVLSLIGIFYIVFGSLMSGGEVQTGQNAAESSITSEAGSREVTQKADTGKTDAAGKTANAEKTDSAGKADSAAKTDGGNKANTTAPEQQGNAKNNADTTPAASANGRSIPPATREKASDKGESTSNKSEKKTSEESNPEDKSSGDKKAVAESFFQKLAAHEDVNILVIGDSIGAGIGASDEANRWDNLLRTYLQRKYKASVNIQNECFGGCTSYGTYVHLKSLTQTNSNFDLTIVCCGQNDSDDGFSQIYEALLRNINAGIPRSSVICILESTQKGMTDRMETIRDLAVHYHAGIADTISAFTKNYDSLSSNGFYPNDEGQEMYFRTIANIIDPLADAGNGIKIGAADSVKLPDPVNADVTEYDVLTFYPADQLERTDAIRYTMTLPYTDSEGAVLDSAAGMLGIEMYSPVGEYPVTCAIDGEILGETNIINYTEFDEARYYNFGSFTAARTIRIKFETEEAADRFTGLYVSSAG